MDPQVEEIKHQLEDLQPKTIREKLNGSFKPLMIGGGITITALLTWVFSAGGRDSELSALKIRMDKMEPIIVCLQIEQASLKSTVLNKLESISGQIEDLKEEIKTLRR